MVICSNTEYTVGTIVRDRVFRDQRGRTVANQPLYILKVVGFQDWVDHLIAEGTPATPAEIAQAKSYKYFYLISTD